MGIRHFSQIFKAPREATIIEILSIVESIPRFVEAKDTKNLNDSVTLGEIEVVLKWFKRDMSPGPDGWPMEFYLTFFDHIGFDLLLVIQDCRLSGQMHEGFNSTFIALIPKADHPQSFYDYRPVSLCN